MPIYFIVLYFLLYTFLAWRRQDWALSLLLFLLPAYQIRFNILGLPSTLLEGMILISFGVWVARNHKQIIGNIRLRLDNFQFLPRPASGQAISNFQFYRYPFDIEIILILIISWIGIVVAGFSKEALGIWKAYFFEPALVYILIFNIFRDNNANLQIDANAVDDGSEAPSTKYQTPNKLQIQNFKFEIGKIVFPLAMSAIVISLIAILQRIGLVVSPENFWPRVTGPFSYPNALGLYLAPLIPLAVGYLLFLISNFQFPISKQYQIPNIQYSKLVVLILSILLSVVSLFLASSEGAIVGILVATFFTGIFYLAWRLASGLVMRIGKVLLVLVLVFVLVSPFIFLKIVPENKYFDFGNKALNFVSDKILLKDFSGEVRKQQWREVWQFLTENPKNFVFGAGLSGYQSAVEPYHQAGIFFNFERDPRFYNELVWGAAEYKARHWRPVEIYIYPHSLVLNLWMELGVMGVMVFIWLIYKIIFNFQFSIFKQFLISNIQYFNIGVLGAIIVVIVHGIVDVPYFKNDLSVIFWVIVALVGFYNFDEEDYKFTNQNTNS